MRVIAAILILTLAAVVSGQTTQFKLSGEHVFRKAGATKWRVSRIELDPESGDQGPIEEVAGGKGESIKLKLKAAGDKETIYQVTSEGEGFSEVTTVRVFKPWKLSSYTFKSKASPAVRAFVVFPKLLNPRTRVMFIMHTLARRPDRDMDAWVSWASRNNYILVGPKFDEENWPGSRSYNLGNLFAGNEGKGKPIPKEKWSFQVVEDIFSELRAGVDSMAANYDMFGHSSGAQFVQRFTFFVPEARVRLAIAANAGWYTLPDLETEFPYGLKHPELVISDSALRAWAVKYLLIMRGTKNVKITSQVRQTELANEQGPNRFKRAGYMFKKMKDKYPDTNWRLIDVPGVAHSQTRMAEASQRILQLVNKQNQNN